MVEEFASCLFAKPEGAVPMAEEHYFGDVLDWPSERRWKFSTYIAAYQQHSN